ncbi:MAG: LuxR C-terminal-related transcriptional regulator [Chloroflexota bacterium]
MQPENSADVKWLTATKLHPPRLRKDIIQRKQLLTALHDAAVSHPLTLMSAPAGYGKTTLLAEFVDSYPELLTAWLSLDEEDNDPARFLGAVVAAIQRPVPACGTRSQVLLTSLPAPGADVRRVIGALINDFADAQSDSLVLILDDLHLVTEPTVYVALDYLLERLPPQMHVVVSARHDPPLALARLRARGQLAEVRLHQMRFTPDETTAFLNGQMHMGLTPEELSMLYTGTEGWAAGLRLLANSLGRIPASTERGAFINRLAQTSTHVFDFLADEVLARQSTAVRTFLLETSILPELTPGLCQAVTGRSDTTAMLEDVYRRNLFLVAMDEAGKSYRYHHLFAEFLRRRLMRDMPERVTELHRRAAEAETNPARAISHYLAAGFWEQAAKRMEQVGEQLLDDGFSHTLRSWIESLPVSVREMHPRLIYILGVCALQRGDLEQASSLLERARRGFEMAGDEMGQGEVLLGLVDVASQGHDYERQAVSIGQALALPLPPHGRVHLLMARVWQSINEGNWEKADVDLDGALRITLESGEAKTFGFLAPILRAHVALLPGGTGRLEHYCRQALARFGEGIGPVQAGAHSLLGYIDFLHGRMDEAVVQAEQARSISQQLGGFPFLDSEVDLVLMGVSSARGEYAAVEHHWQARLPWVEQTPPLKFWTVTILYYIGRAQWLQGNLEQARITHGRMSAVGEGQELPEAMVSRGMMRALLEMSDRRYPDAERTLQFAINIEDKNPQCLVFGIARLLLAHLYLVWKRPQAGVLELASVLADCERRDMPGLILREGEMMVPLLRLAVERGIHPSFATRLLGLFGESVEMRRVYVPDTGETLTAREVEVLRLIAQGVGNREITGQLVITEATVKTHVTSILRKLNVTSRTQAAARARDLGIV